MDILIAELMEQELKAEVVAKAQHYEIFVVLGQMWTEYMQKYFIRAKKYIRFIADKPQNDTRYVFFGWFRTIARKYYVHIAVEPCIDTDLENDHARITCFKISSIAVYPYKKQGLSLFLSTIALFFDKFKLLVNYYKIEGVMNKKILRSLLNDGWRKRNDADIYDTTLYKKVE